MPYETLKKSARIQNRIRVQHAFLIDMPQIIKIATVAIAYYIFVHLAAPCKG